MLNQNIKISVVHKYFLRTNVTVTVNLTLLLASEDHIFLLLELLEHLLI